MNNTFKKRQLSFFLQLTVFSIALFSLHYIIIRYLFKDIVYFYPLWQIYLFHFLTVFLVYAIINLQNALGKKKIFYTFMVLTFLKMALAIVFLLPLLFSGTENKQTDVFNFFIPYFLFLAMEVYAIAGFLKKM